MRFFVEIQGRTQGPFTVEEVEALHGAGRINRSTRCRPEGKGEWSSIYNLVPTAKRQGGPQLSDWPVRTFEPHRLDTDNFPGTPTKLPTAKRNVKRAITNKIKIDFEAIRKTVLNAYSHWPPTTAGESEFRHAVALAEKLTAIIKSRR